MVGTKRKEAPRSHRPSRNVQTKKPKIEVPLGKKSTKKPVSINPAAESDDPGESDSTESNGFSGFSEDDQTETSSMDEAEGENSGTKVTDLKPTKGIAKSVKPTMASNGPSNSTSSKEAHAKQKVLAQERKASKPNADFVARTKKIWERLRRKSHVPLAERKELVTELFDIITGRVKDFVFKHDSVRVIQTALKYANLDQRKMIARELKGEYRGLAESRYAKFLIGKMLVHGDAEIRDMIVPEFY
ncbi:MAG: pumilio domain member 6, partial [Pleopsidium flavum]